VATPSPRPLAPALTPSPAILRALADVGEVDLAKGLGQRRLAELLRREGRAVRTRRWRRIGILVLLGAAAGLLLLALR
jgi:hypothetical protein